MTDQIAHLRSIFANNSARTLFIDHQSERHQTYADVERAGRIIAEQLAELGVKPGDKVCILADNSLELLNLFFGIWTIGACAVPLNPQLANATIADILNSFDRHLLLVGVNHLDLAQDVSALLKEPTRQTTASFATVEQPAGSDAQADFDLSALLTKSELDGVHHQFLGHLDGEQPCMIIFTSGSTSTPKGVSIGMNRLVTNERVFCEALGINADSRFVHMFPMSYLAGTHNLLLLPICVGASIVVSPPLAGATLFDFWNMVRTHDINTLWFTATMLSMLLKVDDGADTTWLKDQIKCALVGMAPLPEATKLAFETRFNMHLHENFALSETAFISSSLPGKSITPGSKGFVLDGVKVQARDLNDTNRLLPQGEPGELFVSSPSLMLGYFNASDSDNANLTSDGFFTGDIGFVENGELYLTGRKKDLIIRGGINIAPALVESCIATLPDVLEVSVVGVPHAEYGEEVAAALVLNSGATPLTARQLQNLLKGKLAYFQQPKSIKILEHMPKGLTGKIDKNAVRQLFATT